MVEETIAWFGGVDWGSEKHQACLLDTQGAIVGEREFPHSGKGLSELADWILSVRLQIADPRLIELRAWSRLAEELQGERVRLSNRLHQQLWRYYPRC